MAALHETQQRERRVALTPDGVRKLSAAGHSVTVESGAGTSAGFTDAAYTAAGATITDRQQALDHAEIILTIDGHIDGLRNSHVLVGQLDPLWQAAELRSLAAAGATLFALELLPRITRAQTMDVLSSMATVAGNEAVLLAARRLPKMFPLMMTAAGTVPAARMLVLGAGVAGLQAIATGRRLGAVVEGYDVRPAAAEQIRSLGAKVVELDLETDDSEDSGGYARTQNADLARRQRELLAAHVSTSDVVITTAAIPGAASPLLVTADMVDAMAPGSVIVDMAAARGGNCELTRADEVVEHAGVSILGPTDLASGAAATASQMYSNNVVAFLTHLIRDDAPAIDLDDEITVATLVASDGAVVHPGVLERLA